MRDRSVHVTVGKPLLIENWRDIPSDEMLINHFREKVEILGQS